MDHSRVSDNRRIKLENIMKEGYIGFLEGRPNREKVINPDDMCNLTIALNTTKTIDEFLKII
ncbi:MAG: hypothetical protein JW795_04465 [Chitinivibrionales bacterium]|nr:hypothetical protein [Chitinivibrionales bacterium]